MSSLTYGNGHMPRRARWDVIGARQAASTQRRRSAPCEGRDLHTLPMRTPVSSRPWFEHQARTASWAAPICAGVPVWTVVATSAAGVLEDTTRPAGSKDLVTWTPTSTANSTSLPSFMYRNTLWPSVRRPGVARRNAHTSSSSAGHKVGNSRHVVFAFTTAVGHSVVRSTVTSYSVIAYRQILAH